NNETWPEFNTGESFDVAAEQEFQVKMSIQTAYICTYQDK
ncbi:MAG: DUF1255 family protein, partial [Arenicella sp.]|nr:DUF1255 family protein [Arenicella sp.]